MRKFWVVLGNDLRVEWHARDMMVSMITFVVLSVFLFDFALTNSSVNIRKIFPGILWITFLFSGMVGIGKTFGREQVEEPLTGVGLAPGNNMAIFMAKLTMAWVMMAAVEVIAAPLDFLVWHEPWRGQWLDFGLVLAVGSVGIVGVGTLLSAITACVRAGDVLFPLLLMPLEVPVVIMAVQATRLILAPHEGSPWPWIRGLVAYDVIFLVLPMIMYDWMEGIW